MYKHMKPIIIDYTQVGGGFRLRDEDKVSVVYRSEVQSYSARQLIARGIGKPDLKP